MIRKPAQDIRPGDVLLFLGEPHLIDRIDPYEGPFGFVIGIARDESGWGISLEDTVTYEIAGS